MYRDSNWHSDSTFFELIFLSQLLPTRWRKENGKHGSINQSKHGLSCKVSGERVVLQTLTGVLWCDWWPQMAEMSRCHWSWGTDQSCLKVVEGPLDGMIHAAVMGMHHKEQVSLQQVQWNNSNLGWERERADDEWSPNRAAGASAFPPARVLLFEPFRRIS